MAQLAQPPHSPGATHGHAWPLASHRSPFLLTAKGAGLPSPFTVTQNRGKPEPSRTRKTNESEQMFPRLCSASKTVWLASGPVGSTRKWLVPTRTTHILASLGPTVCDPTQLDGKAGPSHQHSVNIEGGGGTPTEAILEVLASQSGFPLYPCHSHLGSDHGHFQLPQGMILSWPLPSSSSLSPPGHQHHSCPVASARVLPR